jgi:hypothetical protein
MKPARVCRFFHIDASGPFCARRIAVEKFGESLDAVRRFL